MADKRCALVCAAAFNAEHFLAHWREGLFDAVIAVDRGYRHLADAGVAPDIAIGDFDSLGYVPEDVEAVTFPSHKDQSDFELAMAYAADEGFTEAWVYGGLGGRLDHTLGCLYALAAFTERGMTVHAVDEAAAVEVLVGPCIYSMPAREDGIVSVFSASDVSRGVSIEGLEYAITNAELTNREALGLSNEFVGEPAHITVESGTLFVIHPLD